MESKKLQSADFVEGQLVMLQLV